MIEKLDVSNHTTDILDAENYVVNVAVGAPTIIKINELVDAVNAIQKEREAERFEIQEWIGILGTVRKSVNKLETMAKNTNTVLKSLVETKHEEPADPYAEQRKWIGKLCRLWDYEDRHYTYDILTDIEYCLEYPYKTDRAVFKYCEPVPEDLIYKGE